MVSAYLEGAHHGRALNRLVPNLLLRGRKSNGRSIYHREAKRELVPID